MAFWCCLNHRCVFDVAELAFLGHVFSGKGLFPLMSSIEKTTKAPSPTNISELCSLLGLAGFFSKLISHFADVVEPMRALLHENVPFNWSGWKLCSHLAEFFTLWMLQLINMLTTIVKLRKFVHRGVDASGAGSLEYECFFCAGSSICWSCVSPLE